MTITPIAAGTVETYGEGNDRSDWMRVLVTGSSGLIGSEAVTHFDRAGHDVVGVDNNMRAVFFGPDGDTTWNRDRLLKTTKRFTHHEVDIRDRDTLDRLVRTAGPFDAVIHCAAQPSHDRARDMPLVDFDVNAAGTINLLEACRLHSPAAAIVCLSTNKVYGDAPNLLDLIEHDLRWDYADDRFAAGIDETMTIDQSTHSLFGASKVAADVIAQEYGRYFGMNVGIFRGGCLTGPNHSGVQLHGFLSHLVKTAVAGETYTVLGYKAKQVRDQIHSHDVLTAFEHFIASPRPGEVYNLGGERRNSASILECFDLIGDQLGRRVEWQYLDSPRRGDHICYITDMAKFRAHYPSWEPEYSLPEIVREIIDHQTGS